MAKPKQNTKRLVAYVPTEMEKALQEEAEEKGTNVSNLVRMILKERENNKKGGNNMLVWSKNEKVKNNEREAINEALSQIDYSLVDEEEIQRWIDDNTITLNKCRNGREVVWIMTENKEACVYVDDLSSLDDDEIEEQLL